MHDTPQQALVHFGREMLARGLTTGSGGNLSVCERSRDRVWITPSGIPYMALTPADMVSCDGRGAVAAGERRPSSELDFHLALYRHRPDIGAVVHTHSVFATTLACMHREILPVHYLVGFAGPKVPLAPYATFGTPALARSITDTIGDHNAVLLANHGLVAVGATLAKAFDVAEEIELVARIYYQTLVAGEPRLLSDTQMAEVLEKFKHYGQTAPPAGEE
ncbi:class II aldolase/adducin family protein [Desulfatitalea alkaliphila]|uniref:Class II aldolase/adducin family protein n=1 Tax=Desulfatitalea alkaliphila TaxID=2929485 RepID=A0AA41R7S3_9BACT|nr:class II aldolase/adducin family protein [Desulfatitalea alkaliphila]MCJ8502790.1 class II aldolase/adducin family protein [Desulfatitalea alkaliphila]